MTIVKLDSAARSHTQLTTELINEWVTKIAELLGVGGPEFADDLETLVRALEADYNVHIGSWTSLADDGDHVPWLAEASDEIEWKFWERYERYLRDDQGFPAASTQRLGEITEDTLGRLEAPERPGAWDRRGLVSGQVQSGKTANYAGLIAKALDSGYKLVVVLAGVHNSLRSQTQARIDEAILGFDTRNALRFDQTNGNRIGVGKLAGSFLPVNSFTSSSEKGDFNLSVAKNIGVAVGGNDPIVLVVKKNKSILTNLYKWATALKQEIDPDTGKAIVRGVPVLVIDDEADHASVDTNGPKRGQDPDEVDPSAINRLIRQFLTTFEKSAYVAYTATPFANIFISPDKEHDEAGKDLFPESFIVNLPTPSTYIGPARVFGLAQNVQSNIDEVRGLPIVRPVADYTGWLPDKHKSTATIGPDLPPSLRQAMLSFLIASAVRRLRGQVKKHNSMLVHVTHFTLVQQQVAAQIMDELSDMRDRITFGEGANPVLRTAAEELFASDHARTTNKILAMEDVAHLAGPVPEFAAVWEEMKTVANEAVVNTVNGTSEDALAYVDNPDGLTVIAVGGNKLSRGLTLEGLSVSYYLRASRMYDTLMQMGRWFGYRPNYVDVCRLYTTDTLVKWYTDITSAAEELQAEFDVMSATGRTPRDFGLRVRQHPDGLIISSPSKLRNATSVAISYSGALAETITFTSKGLQPNLDALANLITSIGPENATETNTHDLWSGVPATEVLAFLNAYEPDPAAIRTQPKVLADYIARAVVEDELTSWTVAVANKQDPNDSQEIASRLYGLTTREALESSTARFAIRRLVSPRHELVTLQTGSPEWTRLLAKTLEIWKAKNKGNTLAKPPTTPSPIVARHARDARHGLILIYPLDPAGPATGEFKNEDGLPAIGYAVSFPRAINDVPIAYKVNQVFWDEQYGFDFDDEGGDE
ncbi:hypothetical protein ASD66_19135 [Nocardioides sp. Root151]|nr:hypothetical protein ASD66_19135 [Nocardioides sp. Root151]